MAASTAPSDFASDRLWQQARACLVRGDLAGARDALTAMLARAPDGDVKSHLLAAQIAWRMDHVRDGTRHALDAYRVVPDDPDALCRVAGVLLEMGEPIAARACLDRTAIAASREPLLLMRAAALRKRLGEHREALALLERVAALGHATPAFRYRLGEALLVNGRLEEAETELAASLAAAPAHAEVAVPLVRIRPQTAEHNHLALLERSRRRAPPGSLAAAALEFARYKTFEDLDQDTDAWNALAHGNELMAARLHAVDARHHAWLDRYVAAWDQVVAKPARTPPKGPTPIFIIGLARSGTTLLERMLGNHSAVATAGELEDFGAQLHWLADTRNAQGDALLERLAGLDYAELGRRYLERTRWRAGDKRYYVDKQPPNWVLAGAIHAALPRAPILNLTRDPMDVCFSNWRAFFGDACAYSYDLASLARFFLDYERTLAHWHATLPDAILDVAYADLVNAPEATLRRVFDFCGLKFEPGCDDITRNDAPSATLSAAQVRAPMHDRAFGEWRRYAWQLQPLERALEAGRQPRPAKD